MSGFRLDLVDDGENPISLVESLAEYRNWSFERHTDDTIRLSVEGSWKNYLAELEWSRDPGILVIVCSYEITLVNSRMDEFFRVMNLANRRSWLGAFCYDDGGGTVDYCYRLKPGADSVLTVEEVAELLDTIAADCDRFYPSFNLVRLGRKTAGEAIRSSIVETHGTA